uniref:Uncharacterized protein n=1 Tax=Glossina pallidipes TaxID=7398 RepID=A0A1A9Z0N2_GLOPL
MKGSVKFRTRVEIPIRIEIQKFRDKIYGICKFPDNKNIESFCAIMDNLSIVERGCGKGNKGIPERHDQQSPGTKKRVRHSLERHAFFYNRRGYPKTKAIHSVNDWLQAYCGLCLNIPSKPSSSNGSLLPVLCGKCFRACGQIDSTPLDIFSTTQPYKSSGSAFLTK